LTRTPETSADFAGDHERLARASTAERVAEVLRDRVTAGYFRPGARLSEDVIGGALGVSRNTLREAFRLLSHERLVMHHLNRGVFVRMLSADDVHDVYAVRRIIEIGAIRAVGEQAPGDSRMGFVVASDLDQDPLIWILALDLRYGHDLRVFRHRQLP